MALSIGFIHFVSSTNAIQATGLLTLTPVGLMSPTEHASLRWPTLLRKNSLCRRKLIRINGIADTINRCSSCSGSCLCLVSALLAEILFLRRQLALYQERQAKARRPSQWRKRRWSGCRCSSIGAMRSSSPNRGLSFAGIVQVSVWSGDGSRAGPDAPRCPRIFVRSCGEWLGKILAGARNGSPMSFY